MTYRSIYDDAESARWRRIADYYRERISSGKLAPGSKLPSTQELAKKHDVSVYCVQYALSALTHEKLISRRPRYGTIVNECPKVIDLKVVGLILFVYDYDQGFNAFRSMLIAELSKQLQAKGCEAVTLVENGSAPGLLDRVRGTIRKLGIQAIVPFSCAKKDMPIFQKINIPRVYESRESLSKSGVFVLREEFPGLAVKALADKGCRKPALITVFTNEGLDVNDPYERPKHLFFENYKNEISEYGMEYRDEFICKTRKFEVLPIQEQIEHGYESVRKLWAGNEKPDSIILFTDELLPGVAMAIAELGLSVPEDLTVVSLHNSSSQLYVPFNYIKIELDLNEYASAILEKLFSEFRRENTQERIVHYKIVAEQ